jgi:mRNA interferase HigB
MELVGRNRLLAFCEKHPDARPAIGAWEREVRAATWAGPQDIKDRYRTASFLKDNVVIFNIKGNKYRLRTRVLFSNTLVVVERCGTHAEYDRW